MSKKLIALAVTGLFIFSIVAPAKAVTVEEIQAQIAALQAQIQASQALIVTLQQQLAQITSSLTCVRETTKAGVTCGGYFYEDYCENLANGTGYADRRKCNASTGNDCSSLVNVDRTHCPYGCLDGACRTVFTTIPPTGCPVGQVKPYLKCSTILKNCNSYNSCGVNSCSIDSDCKITTTITKPTTTGTSGKCSLFGCGTANGCCHGKMCCGNATGCCRTSCCNKTSGSCGGVSCTTTTTKPSAKTTTIRGLLNKLSASLISFIELLKR